MSFLDDSWWTHETETTLQVGASIRPQYGSCLPDDSRLSCNNVDSFECRDCGVETESLATLVEHQLDYDHHTEPYIQMHDQFLDLTVSSKTLFNCTGITNSTILSNTTKLEDALNSTVVYDNLTGLPCLPNKSFNTTFGPNSSGIGESIKGDSFLDSTFSDPTSINRSGIDSKTFRCAYAECEFVAYNNQQLQTHLKTTHWKSECDECGKVYANDKCLRQHQKRVHEKEANFMCSMCNRGFYAKSNLKKHKELCNGVKVKRNVKTAKNTAEQVKYVAYCRMAGCKQFYSSIAVGTAPKRRLGHERSHSTEDQYACHYCGESFEMCSRLSDHLAGCEKRDGGPKHANEVPIVDGVVRIYV